MKVPTTFKAEPHIQRFLDKLPKGVKSDWINAACGEKISRQKDPKLFVRELMKKRKVHYQSITAISTKLGDLVENGYITEAEIQELESSESLANEVAADYHLSKKDLLS